MTLDPTIIALTIHETPVVVYHKQCQCRTTSQFVDGKANSRDCTITEKHCMP